MKYKTKQDFIDAWKAEFGYEIEPDCMTQKEAEAYWLIPKEKNIEYYSHMPIWMRDHEYTFVSKHESYWMSLERFLGMIKLRKKLLKINKKLVADFKKGLIKIDPWEQTQIKENEFKTAKPNYLRLIDMVG
jgi:hypothetical protein